MIGLPRRLPSVGLFLSSPRWFCGYECLKAAYSPQWFEYNDKKQRILFPVYSQRRGYAMRLELTEYGISWKRPDSVPHWKPEKSGDLVPFEEIDKSKPRIDFKCIENEIARSDKRAQDLLSIAFGERNEVTKTAEYNMMRKVQRHKYDDSSQEVRIAILTARIRYFQQILPNFPLDKRMKIRLQECVDKRNKKLRQLRRVDYKKFEWLLEKLHIIFRPLPSDPESVTRKGSLIKLVDLHCQKIIQSKLERYKNELELQREPFLKEKAKTLRWIADTEKRLGLPVSVEVPADPKLLELTSGVDTENAEAVEDGPSVKSNFKISGKDEKLK